MSGHVSSQPLPTGPASIRFVTHLECLVSRIIIPARHRYAVRRLGDEAYWVVVNQHDPATSKCATRSQPPVAAPPHPLMEGGATYLERSFLMIVRSFR